MGSFTKSWSYMLVAFLSFSLCFLVATCVMGSHVYLLRQVPKKKKKSAVEPLSTSHAAAMSLSRSKSMEEITEHVYDYLSDKVHQQVLWYCTGLSLSAFYLQITIAFFYRLNEMRVFGGHNWCADYITSLSLLWTSGKYFMYMVYIARVRVVFSETAYGYSNRFIYFLYFAVSAVLIPLTIAVPFFSGGSMEKATGNAPNDKFALCVSEINPYLLTIGFLVDTVISPTLVFLFIRPLRMFFRDSCHHVCKNVSIRDIEVQLLPLKYTVTVSIGVVSTITGMVLMAATDAGVLVVIDGLVNMICLVTMTSHWKQVYWRLCAPLLQTIAFFNCCFDDQLRRNLSRIIAFFSSAAEMERYRKELTASKIGSSKAMSKSMSSKGVTSKETIPPLIDIGSDNDTF